MAKKNTTTITSTIKTTVKNYVTTLDAGKRNSKETTSAIFALENAGWSFTRPNYKEGLTVCTPTGEKFHVESSKNRRAAYWWNFDAWMAYRRLAKTATLAKAVELVEEITLHDNELGKRADKETLARFAPADDSKKTAKKTAKNSTPKKAPKKTPKKTAKVEPTTEEAVITVTIGEEEVAMTMERADKLQALIAYLAENSEDLTAETIGTWIWVTGNTREHKDTLKECGCFWSAKKTAWYFMPVVKRRKGRGSFDSVDAVRAYRNAA